MNPRKLGPTKINDLTVYSFKCVSVIKIGQRQLPCVVLGVVMCHSDAVMFVYLFNICLSCECLCTVDFILVIHIYVGMQLA